MAGLNKRQQLFCNEYIVSLNATDAAKKAGYSEKTSYSIGQRLLKNVEIKKYIDERLDSIHNERIMTKTEILEIYTEIARNEKNSVKDIIKALDSLAKCLILFKDDTKDNKDSGFAWEKYLDENEQEEYLY